LILAALAAAEPDLRRGAQLWMDNCTVCHGFEGRGDGPGAVSVGRSLPDLTVAAWWKGRSDERVVAELTGRIPTSGASLDAAARGDIVAWLRSNAR
jgi:mono/diheme cytochrome c family protein